VGEVDFGMMGHPAMALLALFVCPVGTSAHVDSGAPWQMKFSDSHLGKSTSFSDCSTSPTPYTSIVRLIQDGAKANAPFLAAPRDREQAKNVRSKTTRETPTGPFILSQQQDHHHQHLPSLPSNHQKSHHHNH
jgi:hypothetical protein